jgi:hypothetical protein
MKYIIYILLIISILIIGSSGAMITKYPENYSGKAVLSGTQPNIFNDSMFTKDGIGSNGLNSGHYQSEKKNVTQNITEGGIPKGLLDFINAPMPVLISISA